MITESWVEYAQRFRDEWGFWPISGGSEAAILDTPVEVPAEEPVAAVETLEAPAPEVPETPEAEAPETPEAPEPETPPAARTLRDVYEDVQANRPVLPSEQQALNAYFADDQRRQEAERQRKEQLSTLYPDTHKAIVEDVKESFGDRFDDRDLALLDTLIEKRIHLGEDSLKSRAEAAHLSPVFDYYAENLVQLMGGSAQARQYVSTLAPSRYIETAAAFASRTGTASEDEVKAWLETGKEPKRPVTVAQAKKYSESLIQKERDAHPERRTPAPSGVSYVPGQQYTLAEIEAMPYAQWSAIPKAERDSILAAAHAARR